MRESPRIMAPASEFDLDKATTLTTRPESKTLEEKEDFSQELQYGGDHASRKRVCYK